MKGYCSFACCLAVLLTVYTSSTDAQSSECGIYADSLAHPTDCTKYYKLTMHSCPDGQLFNKDTKKCDLPENTSCGAEETTPQQVWTTTYAPDTTTTEEIPTEVPTTEVPTTTPEPITTTEAPTTTPKPITTTEELPTTTLPLETTVTTFAPTTPSEPPVEPTTGPPTEPPFETTTEVPVETTTESPTEPPVETTTEVPTTTMVATTPTPEVPYFTCPAVDDPNVKIRYAHETNCDYYYLCNKGSPLLYTCLKGNHFNPLKKICNPINQAGCDRCPDVPEGNVVVRLPHETVCQYYYRCDEAGGPQQLYQCTPGMQFSRSERTCTNKSEAFCTLLITEDQY